jgi:outer membrane protein TolC
MMGRIGRLVVGPFPLSWAVLLGMLALLLGGCSRAHYRRQADRDAYCLIEEKASDPRWDLQDYSITPDPRSRLFDPFNPDLPPLPPDDPTSHSLMHCVDGKHGWRYWHRNGDVGSVENCRWKRLLPYNDQGEVQINREGAVELALINSRELQRAKEALYLSALDVSFERFRFDVQFFGSNALTYTADGRIRGTTPTQHTLENDTELQARKLLATGGELVATLANSFVWQFAGPDGANINTLANLSLVQPLLRAGGRAIALESLTDSERNLVANVRQMEHFRRGFYAQIVAGRAAGTGPARSRLLIAALNPGGVTTASGFLGLLGDQVRIRNQRQNLRALQSNVRRLEALNEANKIDRFQVDFTRQTLFSSQTRLLALVDAYEDRLENYKITLGLPSDLPVVISDPLVANFDLISPDLMVLRAAPDLLLDLVRAADQPLPDDLPSQLATLLEQTRQQLAIVEKDVEGLNAAAPQREQDLERLSSRPELVRGDVDPMSYNVERLRQRVQAVNDDYRPLAAKIQATSAALQRWPRLPQGEPAAAPKDGDDAPLTARDRLTVLLTDLSQWIAQLSLVQARARLDAIRLVDIEMDPREALHAACQHRLDWMNARAALVDIWRQIEIRADALRADLDFTFNGSLNNIDNNPLNFQSTRGVVRMGVQFDAPLTRMIERNLYREALVNYQQARREYLLFTDRVYQELRTSLRTIRTAQLNFEIERAAVLLAAQQVDVAQLRLIQPPKVGETSSLSVTTARDLTDALSNLLNSQNNILAAFLDYESQRIGLDYDLGTMRLDERGIWIDPGPIRPKSPAASPAQSLKAVIPEPEDAAPLLESLPPPL